MRRLTIDPARPEPHGLQTAVDWLRDGGIVIFPTDTLYGATIDPASSASIARLFALKGRLVTSAFPFVAASTAQVEAACGALIGANRRLADAFWPGPLSLLLDAPPHVDAAALAGGSSVAVRVPDHALARALAAAFGAPLPATSANRSGAGAVTRVGDLDSVVDDAGVLVIDGGETPGGAPSTIVDARETTPRLIREGAIAWSRVLDFLQK
jgi:L-threonylcarbamoyladenylate synthase